MTELRYDEEATKRLLAVYVTPDVVVQREQFLRVLDRQRGLRGRGGFAERGLRDLQVQVDEFLDAFECLAGQAEHGFDIGFVGGDQLFRGLHLGLQGLG